MVCDGRFRRTSFPRASMRMTSRLFDTIFSMPGPVAGREQ